MGKKEVTKRLAKELRSAFIKLDELENLTRISPYEYLGELEQIAKILIDMLDVPPWEIDEEFVWDYLHGKIEYDEMLARIKEAQESFDPEAYEKYVSDYIECYGEHPRAGYNE